MKRQHRGFTLIEVALFLVITGALFLAVTVGVQNSLTQQKYNDSVQSFVDFLRNVYAGVMNVEHDGTGRGEKAVYGKLISFGENVGNSEAAQANENTIYVYDVIGNTIAKSDEESDTNSALGALVNMGANVVIVDNNRVKPVGVIEDYIPRWATRIENTSNYDLYKGAVLIIRHPKTGTVYTFVKNGTIEVNKFIREITTAYSNAVSDAEQEGLSEDSQTQIAQVISDIENGEERYNLLYKYIADVEGVPNEEKFRIVDADFCVDPMGDKSTLRRDVRIHAGAKNSSGIEIISDEASKCNNPEDNN